MDTNENELDCGAKANSADSRIETVRSREAVAKFVARHHERFESVAPSISAKQVKEMSQAGQTLFLVDVRTAEEQSVSMIPGAITRADFEATVLPKIKYDCSQVLVVPYCTVGLRSGLYCQELLGVGKEEEGGASNKFLKKGHVRNSDGIIMWTFDGEDLMQPGKGTQEPQEPAQEPSTEETKQVHVFSRLWDMAAEGYTTVYFSEMDSTWRALKTWCERTVRLAVQIWSIIFAVTAIVILRFKWVDMRPLPSMIVRVVLMQAWVLMLLLSFVMWFFLVRRMLFEPQHQAPQTGSERLKSFQRAWRRTIKDDIKAADEEKMSRRHETSKKPEKLDEAGEEEQTIHRRQEIKKKLEKLDDATEEEAAEKTKEAKKDK